MGLVFLDTNILLNGYDLPDKFVISSVTLQELEDIKTSSRKDEEIKYKTRQATRFLLDNPERWSCYFYGVAEEEYLRERLLSIEETPDSKICVCALASCTTEFWTDDILCFLIAKDVFGLNAKMPSHDMQSLYKGYVERKVNEEEMAYFYEHLDENMFGLSVNEYLLLQNIAGETVDTLKWTGSKMETVKYLSYQSSLFGTMKPLDDIQKCAMDSIENNDITVLYGKAGSGKTTLPLGYIMENIEKGYISKCYMVYSFEPLKNARMLGFEKGDHVTKLLYSGSVGNILSSKLGDITQVERMLEDGILDIIPTANIRGVEFEADSAVLCTEAQNLDTYTLKTIVQRCKKGCKQIYEGDIIEQKDTKVQQIGMKRLIDVFRGHESFGCVKLRNSYRSELTALADLM